MAYTPVTLTFDLAGLLGEELPTGRAKVWILTNVPGGAIIDADGNEIRLGDAEVRGGEGAFTGLVPTDAATDPTGFQYRVYADYPKAKGRAVWDSGWFSLTADADLADVAAEQYVPPTFMSTAVQQLQGYVDQARDISNIAVPDDVVTALANDAGSDFSAALKTSIADTSIARVVPTQHAPALGLYFPEAEGAVGDGVADDTAAVVAAFAAASATKIESEPYAGTVFAPGGTVHLQRTYNLATLDAPIVATCSIDGRQGSLVVPDDYDDTVLLVGNPTSGHQLQNARLHFPEIRKSDVVTSLTAGSVGVQIQNVYASEIRGHRTLHMETGWWMTGLGMGTAYNQINIGWIDLCKVGLKLTPQTGGWINQNTFLAGEISQSPNAYDGGSTTDIRRTGWRHLILDGTGGNGHVNGNTFDGVSFEGDISEYIFEVRYASHNVWQGATRFEVIQPARTTTLASDTFTRTAHGLSVGDVVIFFATTTRPGGMVNGEAYYVSAVPTADTFKVAETRGGATVTFDSNGSGVVFWTPQAFLFDGSECFNNELRAGYYSYPGTLSVKQVNGARDNVVAPSLPRRGDHVIGRNRLINGDFRVNQRQYASGTFLTSGAFGFDRWKSTTNGTALTYTLAPQGQRVQVTGTIAQTVERANLEPGTYVLSWRGYATGRVYKSGDTPGSYVASPITVDVDGSADMVVEFSGGGNYLSEVQFERGRVATPFERVSSTTALAQCKRYFQRYGSLSGATYREPLGIGAAVSATTALLSMMLPVEMRAVPSVAVNGSTVSTLRVNENNAIFNPSVIAVASPGSTPRGLRLSLTCSGLTAGRALFIDTGDSNACVDLSAEL